MTDLRSAGEKIASAARAESARIDQVDATLCESGDAIVFYAYAGDRTFIASTSLPFVVKADGEFLSSEWGEALRQLLPASILAENVV